MVSAGLCPVALGVDGGGKQFIENHSGTGLFFLFFFLKLSVEHFFFHHYNYN